MKMTFIFAILPLFIQDVQKACVQNLNMAEAFSRQKELTLSHFVENISYITLENNPEALISGLTFYEITNDFIIVRSGSKGLYQILLFDRNTGKFIRKIGNQGRGPGEYRMWSFIPYNPYKEEIYAINASGEILVYNLLGVNIGKINVPVLEDVSDNNLQTVRPAFFNFIDSEIFVGYVPDFSGIGKTRLVLLSKDGILKRYPNCLTWDSGNGKGAKIPPFNFAQFYRWDNSVNFVEAYRYTLFTVTKNSLIPRYYFNWGKYNAPYSRQADINWTNYFFIKDIDENKNFIFLKIYFNKDYFLGYIDKKNNYLTFCKKTNSGISGLKDDISGLMDVIPQDFTESNEMIYVIEPAKLINWFKENPEKAAKAKTKLIWLKNIDEFSNPIIAIAKCKNRINVLKFLDFFNI